jgi:hypothetical protein
VQGFIISKINQKRNRNKASRIDKEKLYEYCWIPADELGNPPDSRIKIKIFDKSAQVMEYAGNMMGDESGRVSR